MKLLGGGVGCGWGLGLGRGWGWGLDEVGSGVVGLGMGGLVVENVVAHEI